MGQAHIIHALVQFIAFLRAEGTLVPYIEQGMHTHDPARKKEESEVELIPTQNAASEKQDHPSAGSRNSDEKAIINRVYWGLLPWMFITGLFTYFDRANFSFAAPALRHDLGLSNAAYGLASGEQESLARLASCAGMDVFSWMCPADAALSTATCTWASASRLAL